MSTTDLIIPHPLLHEREFVLKPLAEIAPHFIHPIMDQSGFISRSGKWISDREKGNIPCYSIDDMNVNNVDFIKIDVDGPDRFVLAGAKNTIEKWKPVIYIEYGSEQMIWEKKLNNYDLKRKDLIPNGYDFIECEVESNNMILVPNGSR